MNRNNSFTIPLGASMLVIILAATTHEIKCGKYEIVCKLSIDSETTKPFYATTLAPLSCKNQQRAKLIATSQQHWGKKK